MGDEQRIDFLDDPNRLFAAQGVIDQPLMSVYLIDGDLDLPTFVVGNHQFERWGSPWVEQGSDHPVRFALAIAGQDMCMSLAHQAEHLIVVKATIPHEQHASRNRA